jgi:hypothetical protein
MIVRKAKASDKHQIFQWWKEIFAYDDNGYTDFYFEHYYETAEAYVIVTEDDMLVGALQVHTRNEPTTHQNSVYCRYLHLT